MLPEIYIRLIVSQSSCSFIRVCGHLSLNQNIRSIDAQWSAKRPFSKSGEAFLAMKLSDVFQTTPVQQVQDYWNSRPCNIRHSPKPIGTREYFDEVEARKHFVEPHIPQFAEFEHWSGKKDKLFQIPM